MLKRVDQLGSDLSIFGHTLFSVTDDASYMETFQVNFPIKPLNSMSYWNVILTKEHYLGIKLDSTCNQEWL